ncbi:MAG TPA: hypothetical protein ENI07_11170 [Desulfobacterales bacterium]|nr:hypothetical protein [Desulfobacterales bacterium]
MFKIAKKIIIFFVVGTLILVPFGASALAQDPLQDEDVTAPKMIVDVLVARPLGLIATVLGIALFVISFPFSAAGGNTEAAYQKLILKPAKYTFERPLGDL